MDDTVTPPASGLRRRNLPAAEREKMIVEAAARFFAEHGFEGQTRELAKTMRITHAAIFRYFPTKEALIERVYDHVYVKRWNPAWNDLIRDRSLPIEERLRRFYVEYAARIFDYEWVRIFVYAGLKGNGITARYLSIVREKFILPACEEIRVSLKLDPQAPITSREEEALWALHGKVFYIALRKFVYGQPTPENLDDVIADDVRVFFAGAGDLFREAVAVSSALSPARSRQSARKPPRQSERRR